MQLSLQYAVQQRRTCSILSSLGLCLLAIGTTSQSSQSQIRASLYNSISLTLLLDSSYSPRQVVPQRIILNRTTPYFLALIFFRQSLRKCLTSPYLRYALRSQRLCRSSIDNPSNRLLLPRQVFSCTLLVITTSPSLSYLTWLFSFLLAIGVSFQFFYFTLFYRRLSIRVANLIIFQSSLGRL